MTENENFDIIPEMQEQAEEMAPVQPAKKKKKVLGRVIYFLLLAVFIGVFVYCAWYIANYAIGSQQASNDFNSLSDMVGALRDQNATEGNDDATIPSGTGSIDDDTDTSGILPEYRDVYAMNPDMVGWIKVPGTVIDYPVMQTKDRPNYYLHRDFYGEHSLWGCIYVREECDVFTPSDNVVVYGHRMNDGKMFAALHEYKDKDYWEENQYFSFDTLYERHTYQIIAVFTTSANIGEGFSYHIFNTADSEAEFDQFMEQVHELQRYDTGLTAEYGDMLVTLSTCEKGPENDRFVVIAKRVS